MQDLGPFAPRRRRPPDTAGSCAQLQPAAGTAMLSSVGASLLPTSLYSQGLRDDNLAATGLLGRLPVSPLTSAAQPRCIPVPSGQAIPKTPATPAGMSTLTSSQSFAGGPPMCVYSVKEKEPLGDVLKRAGKRCASRLGTISASTPHACEVMQWASLVCDRSDATVLSKYTLQASSIFCGLSFRCGRLRSFNDRLCGMQGAWGRHTRRLRNGCPGSFSHVAKNHSQLPVRFRSRIFLSLFVIPIFDALVQCSSHDTHCRSAFTSKLSCCWMR